MTKDTNSKMDQMLKLLTHTAKCFIEQLQIPWQQTKPENLSKETESNENDRPEVYSNKFKTIGWVCSLAKVEQAKEGAGGLISRISIWTRVNGLQTTGLWEGTTTCATESHQETKAQKQAKKGPKSPKSEGKLSDSSQGSFKVNSRNTCQINF